MRKWEKKLLAFMHAECCSHQSVKHYFKGESTATSIPLPIQEKGYHHRLVLGHSVPSLSMMGAEVVAYADSLQIGPVEDIRTQYAHEKMVSSIAGFANATGIPNIAGDAVYSPAYQDHAFAQMTVLGLLSDEYPCLTRELPENDEEYSLVFVGSTGRDYLLAQHLLKANAAWLNVLQSTRQHKPVRCRHVDDRGVVYAILQIAEAAGMELDLPSTELLSVTACDAYVWAVPSTLNDALLTHYNQTFALPDIVWGSAAVKLGRVRRDGQCKIFVNGEVLVDIPTQDLREVKPIVREVSDRQAHCVEPILSPPEDYNDILLQLLAHENIACREMIYEHYDKQAQGRTRIEPGMAEAGLIQLFYEERFPQSMRGLGVALAVASHPFHHEIDPYFSAMNSVALALRKIASIGASPQAVSCTLYSGQLENPEHMGVFSESVCGITDACRDYELKEYPGSVVPLIASDVSFVSPQGAAPVIACVGTMHAVDKAVASAFRYEDSCVLMVGERQEECGGSVYYQLRGEKGCQLPIPKLSLVAREIYALLTAIDQSLVLSCGVIHKGGLAVTIAKMCIPKHMGVALTVQSALSADQCLFSETGGFVLEVAPENLIKIENIFSHYDVTIASLGRTTFDHRIQLQGTIDLSVAFAEEAWRNGLREKLL